MVFDGDGGFGWIVDGKNGWHRIYIYIIIIIIISEGKKLMFNYVKFF